MSESKFSPTKYKARAIYPEIRPGVKRCEECGEEFCIKENPSKSYLHIWNYKRYCDKETYGGSRQCQRRAKAKGERARNLAKHGTTDPYRKIARERMYEKRFEKKPGSPIKLEGHGWYGMVSRNQYGLRTVVLDPLPPEAKSRSMEDAFRQAATQHEDFIAYLMDARKEQRGFKARVRRAIKELRAAQ